MNKVHWFKDNGYVEVRLNTGRSGRCRCMIFNDYEGLLAIVHPQEYNRVFGTRSYCFHIIHRRVGELLNSFIESRYADYKKQLRGTYARLRYITK